MNVCFHYSLSHGWYLTVISTILKKHTLVYTESILKIFSVTEMFPYGMGFFQVYSASLEQGEKKTVKAKILVSSVVQQSFRKEIGQRKKRADYFNTKKGNVELVTVKFRYSDCT